MQQNSNLPVEVTADNLDVDQEDGTAVFTGNVKIGQGDMRLSAPRVLVVYKEDQSGIKTLQATGGVTLVSGQDAAEASRADYNIETGMIEMQGDVLLLQGTNALSSETMVVDTRAGTARMSGRVKTVLQQGGQQ
uniref:lipopolysaccharide transport periplasmic protein LptA n=1 Tax=Roseovarius indicus TaxID=540747 RepID=UPI003B520715